MRSFLTWSLRPSGDSVPMVVDPRTQDAAGAEGDGGEIDHAGRENDGGPDGTEK